jgi:hypothetical protein
MEVKLYRRLAKSKQTTVLQDIPLFFSEKLQNNNNSVSENNTS